MYNNIQHSFTFFVVFFVCIMKFRYVGRTLHKQYGSSYSRIWLDGVQCVGTEKTIGECKHKDWGVHDCISGEDVSISCQGRYSVVLRYFVFCNQA